MWDGCVAGACAAAGGACVGGGGSGYIMIYPQSLVTAPRLRSQGGQGGCPLPAKLYTANVDVSNVCKEDSSELFDRESGLVQSHWRCLAAQRGLRAL